MFYQLYHEIKTLLEVKYDGQNMSCWILTMNKVICDISKFFSGYNMLCGINHLHVDIGKFVCCVAYVVECVMMLFLKPKISMSSIYGHQCKSNRHLQLHVSWSCSLMM